MARRSASTKGATAAGDGAPARVTRGEHSLERRQRRIQRCGRLGQFAHDSAKHSRHRARRRERAAEACTRAYDRPGVRRARSVCILTVSRRLLFCRRGLVTALCTVLGWRTPSAPEALLLSPVKKDIGLRTWHHFKHREIAEKAAMFVYAKIPRRQETDVVPHTGNVLSPYLQELQYQLREAATKARDTSVMSCANELYASGTSVYESGYVARKIDERQGSREARISEASTARGEN
jgi:hypothetical protein